MGIEFRPVDQKEKDTLLKALRGNAEDKVAILMDKKDTSFVGTSTEMHDEEVIAAIRSVPCHY